MPAPKSSKESAKTVQKKKEKVIEDKTFGLKNKKGSKQQKFIKNVTQQIANDPNQNKKVKEKAKKDDLEDFSKIFKPVVQEQKVKLGVDPKSQLCAFFKQGMCTKGDKCKFSHDLAVERKTEKRSIYTDAKPEDESMENWDDVKLEEVVTKKHSEENKKSIKTDIICKHFLRALEDNKYGWFWECPDGDAKCIYRHALPPGFTMKKNVAEKENKALIEDLLDKQVSELQTHTKLTLETFRDWKAKRIKIKREKAAKDAADKEAKYKSGRMLGLSGRDIFTFDPSLVAEGDETIDDIGGGLENGVIDASLFQLEDDDELYDIGAISRDEELHENELELQLDNLTSMEMDKPLITKETPGSPSFTNNHQNFESNNNLDTSQNHNYAQNVSPNNIQTIDPSQDIMELLAQKINSVV